MNKQIAKKFFIPEKPRQAELREAIMALLSHYAGLERKRENFIWKIHARDGSGSTVTITLYTSGNLICMGHGNIFSLTLALIVSYTKHTPQKH